MAWSLLRPLLFQGDAESTHERIVSVLAALGRTSAGRALLRAVSRQSLVSPGAARRVWNLDFRTAVGLAAGFDKNGVLLQALPHLGFGFAEIGSVTPRPQPGNARPRLSRDPSRQAIWNAMGFNNDGVEVVARRLEYAREQGWIPTNFPVGVNLGKNKDTPNEEAHRDYLEGARRFLSLADYLVINVSSPNTPGLRALQEPEGLRRIVDPILETRAGLRRSVPVLLKLAPETGGTTLAELLRALEDQIDGWILTNTLQSNSGGLSGGPLADLSRARLLETVGQTKKPIISVGGILDPGEAAQRVRSGASLVQAYAGYIYGGPAFPAQLEAAISQSG
jgi:dihydroorotate dehydrogenase